MKSNKKYKKMIILIGVVLMVLSLSITAYGASGCQGYAIYRDGAVGGLNWHGGIMNRPNSSQANPCIHIASSKGVTYCTLKTFINGKKFMGVYKPKGGISSSGRDKVAATARNLVAQDIGYTAIYQVYHRISNKNAKVKPSDIWLIRCDGVVEYCYEYNEYRIFGTNGYWNVSKGGFEIRDHHMGVRVTPKTQAQSYMTKVQSAQP